VKISHLKHMITKKTGIFESDMKLVHKNLELNKNASDV